MLELPRNKRILVIVAHPDDELLGLGGSIHRLINEFNCQVRAVILGEGITSRSDKRESEKWQEELNIHKQNILDAQKLIGYESAGIYDFPDNRFDSVALLDVVKIIEKEKSLFKPEIIFTHHRSDTNIDHRRTYDAVITASRPMQEEVTQAILCFETPSSTEWQGSNYSSPFVPNFFIEVSEENLKAKIKGMEAYEFERRKYPHPRSPEALEVLARRWGVAIGKSYAEAFILIRSIL